jgi:hypothetical protein
MSSQRKPKAPLKYVDSAPNCHSPNKNKDTNVGYTVKDWTLQKGP